MTRPLDTTRRRLGVGVIAALALIGALAPACAGASVYGGLGAVGSAVKSGTQGEPGQINPGGQAHGHAFAANSQTGEFYVADEVEVKEAGKKPKTFARVQAFGAKGEFLAENRIAFKVRKEEEEEITTERISSLAVDPAHKKVYLLLAENRAENKAEVEKELTKLEKESTTTEKEIESAEKKHEAEKVATLKKKLEEEQAQEAKLLAEEEALDAGDPSAAELYSFSTEVTAKKELNGKTLLTSSETLKSASESAKASLLDPSGIAVDPKTGDVVISGQQNESATPKEAESLRAAIQRVHSNGELGPRYVDSANCLDEAEKVAGEPACAEDEREWPISPIVTANGRVYVQDGEELWEIPASSEAEKGFKEITVTPRFLYWLGEESPKTGETRVLKGVFSEEEGGTLSYVPGKTASEGTIFMRAEFPNAGENGVVTIHYEESGEGGSPQARELGWTGGQESISTQTKCIVRGGLTSQPLLAGTTGEGVLMLSYESGVVMRFGPEGEGCGHAPTVTPPAVESAHKPLGLGENAKLTSHLQGARAKTTKWRFVYEEPKGGGKHEEAAVTTKYDVGRSTTLEHRFEHEGTYEVTEEVETDELSFPTIKSEAVKVSVSGMKARLALPESLAAGEAAAIKARVEDGAESPLTLKATWRFGDSSEETVEYTGSNPLTIEAKSHAYAKPGEYLVEVSVTDKEGRTARETKLLVVGESAAEKEQHAREAAERAQHEREAREAAERAQHEREVQEAAQRAQHEREAAEAAERKRHEEEAAKGGVLAWQAVRLAGGSIGVKPNGGFTIKLSCPGGAQSCTGTIVLRTAGAVKAGRKKSILVLAGGSFSLTSGQAKTITLRLSGKAKSLLAHSHSLKGRATFTARDATGASHTTQALLTLRLLKR